MSARVCATGIWLRPQLPAIVLEVMIPCGSVAAAVAEVLVPACASGPAHKFGTWRPTKVRTESIAIQAGFGGKCQHVAPSIVYNMGGEHLNFVHMHKQSRWFLSAIAGPRANKGEVTAAHVLDLVRGKFFGAEENEDDTTAVVDLAAVAEKNAGDVDPHGRCV